MSEKLLETVDQFFGDEARAQAEAPTDSQCMASVPAAATLTVPKASAHAHYAEKNPAMMFYLEAVVRKVEGKEDR